MELKKIRTEKLELKLELKANLWNRLFIRIELNLWN
jgi:hypothetical protein